MGLSKFSNGMALTLNMCLVMDPQERPKTRKSRDAILIGPSPYTIYRVLSKSRDAILIGPKSSALLEHACTYGVLVEAIDVCVPLSRV